MVLRHGIEYFRKEHQELRHLADRIEKMLELAAKNDFVEHVKGLTGLRSLEHGLGDIVEHCQAEERIVESRYGHSLQSKERARIDAEHQQVIRAVTDFREELKFATPDRTMAMIVPGMDLVNRLRAHIAYEREMLSRIPESANQSKTLGRKTAGKKTHGKPRKLVARHKAEAKAAGFRPYTLEPHPEL
jgi:hypothetical protein